jgi:hypothetical protein
MMRVDHLFGEITEPQPAPGFLLAPFGWAAEAVAAMVRADRSLFADLFTIDRFRIHLIALAVAHLNLPVPPEIGPLLMRASARQVLTQVLGQPPVGIKRVLSHLPDAVLSRKNYGRLVTLLVDPQAAKVLHHADQINDTTIRVLADLPQKLRKPLAFAVADWPRKLSGLTELAISRLPRRRFERRGVGSRVGNGDVGAAIGDDDRVLGQQAASTGDDAASHGWQCSTPGSGRQGVFAR